MFAVDRFCKDPGTGGLSHTARPTEQIGMSQVVVLNCIFECGCDCALSDYAAKVVGPVFTGRYNKILHNPCSKRECKDNGKGNRKKENTEEKIQAEAIARLRLKCRADTCAFVPCCHPDRKPVCCMLKNSQIKLDLLARFSFVVFRKVTTFAVDF